MWICDATASIILVLAGKYKDILFVLCGTIEDEQDVKNSSVLCSSYTAPVSYEWLIEGR